MNTHLQEVDEDDVIDVRALIARLLIKRWWIAASLFLFTAVFSFAAFTIKPVYRASVLLISASAERSSMSGSLSSALGQLGGLASLAGINVGNSDAATEESLAVLRSCDFTGSFISDKQIMPVLFASRWDTATGKWKGSESEQPTLSNACKYFGSKVRAVSQDKKTGLITLSIDWIDRNKAAEWTNDLVLRLNNEMRSRAIAQADASIGFLEKELATTSVLEVREAINRLIEAQVKQRMLANVTQGFAFRVVDRAMVPDANDPVKPNKLLLLVLGPLVGFAVGIMFVLLSGSRDDSVQH